MAEAIKLTMDGTLLNWLKKVGDSVQGGEVIAEVEADKATVEVEASVSGVITALNAQPGDAVKEGMVIAMIGAADEAGAGAAQPAVVQQQESVAAGATNGSARAAPAPVTPDDGRIKASPLARNMAAEKGIDLRQVQGTGPGGRIIKADIENFTPGAAPAIAQPAVGTAAIGLRQTYGSLPQPGEDVEILDVSRMRRAIADNTILSKQMIPHFYVSVEMDVAALLKLRQELNTSLENEGVKISVNDMVVKAAALTLRKFPNLNTHYYGDKLVRYKHINIGISVALPNNGLMNIVARDADKVALSALAASNKAMADRAREGKVKPEDIRGATFTVSNLGPYNVDFFSAVINPPEAGILAVSAARKVPVVLPDGSLGVGNRMVVTLSVDHRVSDGAEGALYMQEFKKLIENPTRLVV